MKPLPDQNVFVSKVRNNLDSGWAGSRFSISLGIVPIAMLYWVSFVLVTSVSAVLRGYDYRWINLPLDITTIVYATATGVGVFHLLARYKNMSLKRQTVAVIATMFVLVFVFDIGFQLIRTVFGPDAERLTVPTAVTVDNVLAGGLFWFVPFCLWAAAIMALMHNEEARKRERLQLLAEADASAQLARAAEAERKTTLTELTLLRLQLNPHFMCNTLGAVSTLMIEGRHDQANQTIERLADFLRNVADSGQAHDNLLCDEFDIVDSYLAIERFRFGERLQISFELPTQLENALIPNFILQPLVENAVKHAVTQSTDVISIAVRAHQEMDELIVTIQDDGRGLSLAQKNDDRVGIGLSNTKSRLSLRYGAAARLEVRPTNDGYVSIIRIPLEFLRPGSS